MELDDCSGTPESSGTDNSTNAEDSSRGSGRKQESSSRMRRVSSNSELWGTVGHWALTPSREVTDPLKTGNSSCNRNDVDEVKDVDSLNFTGKLLSKAQFSLVRPVCSTGNRPVLSLRAGCARSGPASPLALLSVPALLTTSFPSGVVVLVLL